MNPPTPAPAWLAPAARAWSAATVLLSLALLARWLLLARALAGVAAQLELPSLLRLCAFILLASALLLMFWRDARRTRAGQGHLGQRSYHAANLAVLALLAFAGGLLGPWSIGRMGQPVDISVSSQQEPLLRSQLPAWQVACLGRAQFFPDGGLPPQRLKVDLGSRDMAVLAESSRLRSRLQIACPEHQVPGGMIRTVD